MIELRDAVRRIQGIVIRQRHDACTELDALRALGRGSHHEFGRTDDFVAAGVMLAIPELRNTQFIRISREFEIALIAERWAFIHAVEWRHEQTQSKFDL